MNTLSIKLFNTNDLLSLLIDFSYHPFILLAYFFKSTKIFISKTLTCSFNTLQKQSLIILKKQLHLFILYLLNEQVSTFHHHFFYRKNSMPLFVQSFCEVLSYINTHYSKRNIITLVEVKFVSLFTLPFNNYFYV